MKDLGYAVLVDGKLSGIAGIALNEARESAERYKGLNRSRPGAVVEVVPLFSGTPLGPPCSLHRPDVCLA